MHYANAAEEQSGWPAEMSITVDDNNLEFLELLFIREAWNLPGHESTPSALGPIGFGTSHRPATSVDALNTRWVSDWRTLLAAAPDERNTQRWHDRYGWDGIDRDALDAWLCSVRGESRSLPPIEESPETLAETSLVAAWRRGLRDITTLPIVEWWVQRGDSELIISTSSRHNLASYRTALNEFARTTPSEHRPAITTGDGVITAPSRGVHFYA